MECRNGEMLKSNTLTCSYIFDVQSIRFGVIEFNSLALIWFPILTEFERKFNEISIGQYLIDAHDSTTID